MIRQPHRQRGAILVLVVVVMTVVAGSLAAMGTFAAFRYREVRVERARQVNRAIVDSAAGWVADKRNDWMADPPRQPVELDVKSLLPPEMTASATVTARKEEGMLKCTVATRVEYGVYAASNEVELPMR
jgi:hypothetical protein